MALLDVLQLGLTALGLGFGYMGGQEQDARAEEMAEAHYQQDLLNYQFSWEEAQDAYQYHKEELEIAKYNLKQKNAWQDQTDLRDWIEEDKQRIFDYNNQVDAYNASVQAYETQLDFNVIADDLATNSARLAYQDNLIRLGFQLEDTTTETEIRNLGIGINRQGLVEKRSSEIKGAKINKDSLKSQLMAQKAKYAAELEKQHLEGLVMEGKIRATGQSGRSARKHIAASLSNNQRLQYAIADSLNRDRVRIGLNIESVNQKLEAYGTELDLSDQKQFLDLYNSRVKLDQNERQVHEQLISTNLAFESQNQKQKLDKYGADIRAKQMISAPPILQPEAPKPLERPEPRLQRPRQPRPGPRPRKYVAAGGHGLAALGSGMTSLASAVADLK